LIAASAGVSDRSAKSDGHPTPIALALSKSGDFEKGQEVQLDIGRNRMDAVEERHDGSEREIAIGHWPGRLLVAFVYRNPPFSKGKGVSQPSR
jgi:hypothetical protein